MNSKIKPTEHTKNRVIFTKEMKNTHTILIPNMAEIHFTIIRNLLSKMGYNMVLLKNQGPEVVQCGLKYVHNDTCYPALLVIGQMISALQSGLYDIEHTALMITQTGGGCRASNYIHLLRKALIKAGFENVPVISLNLSGLEKNPGFVLNLAFLRSAIAALVYGDLLMLLNNQVKAYEVTKGESRALVEKWVDILSKQLFESKGISVEQIHQNINDITSDFAKIEMKKTKKVKVGIVGEIYVKYSPLGNNNLEEFLYRQNCEYMVPGIMGFMIFKFDNRLEDIKLYGGSKAKYVVVNALMNYIKRMEFSLISTVSKYPQFVAPSPYAHLKELTRGVIGYGSKMGEGWLLTAEMLELVEHGYENIVCTQPFGCLPNHINGKGMIRKIKSINERANIVPIDYDPSATSVNQENRIKLMLSIAREQLYPDIADAKAGTSAIKV